VISLGVTVKPYGKVVAVACISGERYYFWGTEPPILKESDVQDLVEKAMSAAAPAQETDSPK
jgi:hypothetical protein